MDLELTGCAALVTGSSGGIGTAIAVRLAAEGCDVLVHGRDAAAAAKAAEEVARRGVRTEVVLGDLAEEGAAESIGAAARSFGARILVNNAGPFSEHDWDSAEPADWAAAFDGNVISAVRMTREMVPSMRECGWGRVINVGSRAVTTPLPNMVEYSAAKAAVVNMTTSLARHLAGTGVTANCVSPGVIMTPSLRSMFQERARTRGEDDGWGRLEPEVTSRYAPNPVGRLGRPDDVAAAVAYLAGPVADYVNGINLRVDGGITHTP
ncbi:SDR family NAD(P)-dependent oxidoreductase [Streptomyces sp. NPDC050617]|uniref:SDR family NAD(P)-dependent oxidoreductase n=1 Tax=Streptomyces sp. NPDC050617 TaxID=3154628 RepID=UPI003413EB17